MRLIRQMISYREEYNSLGYANTYGEMWVDYYLVIPNRIKPIFLFERRTQ